MSLQAWVDECLEISEGRITDGSVWGAYKLDSFTWSSFTGFCVRLNSTGVGTFQLPPARRAEIVKDKHAGTVTSWEASKNCFTRARSDGYVFARWRNELTYIDHAEDKQASELTYHAETLGEGVAYTAQMGWTELHCERLIAAFGQGEVDCVRSPEVRYVKDEDIRLDLCCALGNSFGDDIILSPDYCGDQNEPTIFDKDFYEGCVKKYGKDTADRWRIGTLNGLKARRAANST